MRKEHAEMPKKVNRSEKSRAYDDARKADTFAKLKSGIEHLRRQKEHREGKPITAYKLCKYTKVTIRTIRRHPEIMETLTKERGLGVELKSAVVKTEKIYSLEQAVGIINQLTSLYNETKDKYNQAMKQNSALNLQVVKLQSEVAELNKVVRNRVN